MLYFSIDLSVEEGGGTMELVSGGRDMEVTAQNVYDYVRKYAEYRMIKTQEKSIEVGHKKLSLPLNQLKGHWRGVTVTEFWY